MRLPASLRLALKGWRATRTAKVSTPRQLPLWMMLLFAAAFVAMGALIWGTSQGYAWAYILFMGMSSFLWALAVLALAEALRDVVSIRFLQGPLRAWHVVFAFASYVPVAAHAVATFGLAEGSEAAGTRAMLAMVAAFVVGKIFAALAVARAKFVALKEKGLKTMSAHERLAEAARDAHKCPPQG